MCIEAFYVNCLINFQAPTGWSQVSPSKDIFSLFVEQSEPKILRLDILFIVYSSIVKRSLFSPGFKVQQRNGDNIRAGSDFVYICLGSVRHNFKF